VVRLGSALVCAALLLLSQCCVALTREILQSSIVHVIVVATDAPRLRQQQAQAERAQGQKARRATLGERWTKRIEKAAGRNAARVDGPSSNSTPRASQ
jgi:hypothetical protein